jgi:mxaK protein
MRRARGHLVFTIAAGAFGLLSLGGLMRLHQAQKINATIAEWAPHDRYHETSNARMRSSTVHPAANTTFARASADTLPAAAKDNKSAAVSQDNTSPATSADARNVLNSPVNLLPEGRLAHAVALSRTDYDGALAAYKAIIQSNRPDLRRIALYDLGNLHLRQALQAGLAEDAQALPLLELAKQSYRDLLRADPNDWDARYNLERTLRLAPEDDDDDEDSGPPSPNEHERTTIADPRMDLP